MWKYILQNVCYTTSQISINYHKNPNMNNMNDLLGNLYSSL